MIKFRSKIAMTVAALAAGLGLMATGAGATYALVASSTPPGTYRGGVVQHCVKVGQPVYPHTGVLGSASGCKAGYQIETTNAAGQPGAQGPAGKTGAASTVPGPAGPRGSDGLPGVNGKDGADAPAATYGIGLVNIARGGTAATTWAKVSTPLGGPIGDTAGQSFRMTCSAAKAPCDISAQAYATADGVKVYPRLLIQKSSIDTGAPIGLCEYADGPDNSGGTQAVGTSPTSLQLGVGGSLDCGAGQTATAGPDGLIVNKISTPAGYYDIEFSVMFSTTG